MYIAAPVGFVPKLSTLVREALRAVVVDANRVVSAERKNRTIVTMLGECLAWDIGWRFITDILNSWRGVQIPHFRKNLSLASEVRTTRSSESIKVPMLLLLLPVTVILDKKIRYSTYLHR
jgi:hypothetical protein